MTSLRPTPLVNALVVMKHCYEPEYLKNNPDIVFIHGAEINTSDRGKIFLKTLFEYFSKRTQLSGQEKHLFLEHKIDPIMRPNFKSTWDFIHEEGREEGREEGEIKVLTRTIRGLISRTHDISDDEISIITGAAIKTIHKIRLEIEAEKI